MKIVTIQEFLKPFPDFHEWDDKRQVDYLSFYLQGDTMGGRIWYSASDIEELYTEIPQTPYGRIARYLSEESQKPRGGRYVRKPSGYVLSKHRYDEIESALSKSPRRAVVSSTLDKLKRKVKDAGEEAFLTETIDCYEIDATRASIVMMWALVIAHLRNRTLTKYLSIFNSEIQVWNKGHPRNQLNLVSDYDDFGEIPDHRFIELAKCAKVINKDQKSILEEKLKIRNMAGHPTTAKIAPSKADEFIEDLALNVLI